MAIPIFPAFHIIIKGGAVTASSLPSMGIGGNNSNITIKGGLVKVSSDQWCAIGGTKSNITIDGGSVKASSVSSSPTNDHGEKVYCCTIENLNSKKVIIDRYRPSGT